jgi:hypothetical protein
VAMESRLVSYLSPQGAGKDRERDTSWRRYSACLPWVSSLHFLSFSQVEIWRRRRVGDGLRGDRGRGRRAVEDGTEPIGDEVGMDSEEKVVSLLKFVNALSAHLLEVRTHRLGGLRKMIMGDLGEEEMVHHMAIGDVVAEGVNHGAVLTIHSFKSSIDKLPGGVVMDESVRGVVLEVSHSDEPPAEDKERGDVEVEEGGEVPLAESEDGGSPGDHHRGAHQAFDVFAGGGVFPHSLQRQGRGRRRRLRARLRGGGEWLTSEGRGMKWLPSGAPKR